MPYVPSPFGREKEWGAAWWRRCAPVQVPDITAEGAYRGHLRDILVRAGYRAVLAVPLIREQQVIGAFIVGRKRPGEFPREAVELVATFASQSALAIQNARLFHQLERASRHKSRFLANMSHELRTPLNAILGYTEMLQEDAVDLNADGLVPDLKKVNAAGKHLLELINSILDLSKIEAGKMELHLEDFSVAQMVEDIAAMVQPLAEKNGNQLEVRCDAGIGIMHADLTKVRQVLLQPVEQRMQVHGKGHRVAGGAARGVRQRRLADLQRQRHRHRPHLRAAGTAVSGVLAGRYRQPRASTAAPASGWRSAAGCAG